MSLLLLLPVVALEAAILKPVLRLPWSRAFAASFRANGVTMGIGYILLLLLLCSLFLVGSGPAKTFEWNVVYWHLLPWGCILSYLVEKRVVYNYLEGAVVRVWVESGTGSISLPDEDQVKKACAFANIASYILIAAIGHYLDVRADLPHS